MYVPATADLSALPLVDTHTLRLLRSRHLVATITTESGSRYTLVKRASGVTLIHDTKGWALTGDFLYVSPRGRMFLRKDGAEAVRTTRVASVHVLEN